MKTTILFFTAFFAGILVVSAQYQQPYVVHNITHHIVNTTYVQQPVPPGFHHIVNTTYVQHPAPPGFIRNVTGPGYVRSYNSHQGQFNPVNQNGLIVGTPGPYNVVLIKQVYNKPSRWLQTREKIIQFPNLPRIISAIHVIDMQNFPGGLATILSGGVGFTNVSIRLFSERSTGFNFRVIIYGRGGY